MGSLVLHSHNHTHIMSLYIVLEGRVKADKVDTFKAFAGASVAKTKAAAGCDGVRAAIDKSDRYILIVQQWSDAGKAAEFVKAVQAEGAMAKMIGECMEPGSFRRRELSPYGQ